MIKLYDVLQSELKLKDGTVWVKSKVNLTKQGKEFFKRMKKEEERYYKALGASL